MTITHDEIIFFLPNVTETQRGEIKFFFDFYSADFGINTRENMSKFFANLRYGLKFDKNKNIVTRENFSQTRQELEKLVKKDRKRLELTEPLEGLVGLQREKAIAYLIYGNSRTTREESYKYRKSSAFNLVGKRNTHLIKILIKNCTGEDMESLDTIKSFMLLSLGFWMWTKANECTSSSKRSLILNPQANKYERNQRAKLVRTFNFFLGLDCSSQN
jgi:predicted chitinase